MTGRIEGPAGGGAAPLITGSTSGAAGTSTLRGGDGATGTPETTGGWTEDCAGATWVWVYGSATSGGTNNGVHTCQAYSFENPGPGGFGSGPDAAGAPDRFLAVSISSDTRPTRGSKLSRTWVSTACCSASAASSSFPLSTNSRMDESSFSCFLLFSRASNSTSAE